MGNKPETEEPAVATTRLVFDGTKDEALEKSSAAVRSPTEPPPLKRPVKQETVFPEQMEDKDLDDLSVEELQRQQEEIDRKIQAKKEAEKKAVIDQIVKVVNTYHIPVAELVEALGGLKVKRKGVKAKPKYQDPASGMIWSGRGKEPAWIRGKDRKKFLIPD